jgi:DNA-directed DNA polymerase III PolC
MSNSILLFKSHYSLLSSLLTLDKSKDDFLSGGPISIFSIANKYNIQKLFLCDDNMGCFFQAYSKSKEYQKQLIFGLQLKVKCDLQSKENSCVSDVIIWMKNSNAYKDLLAINNFAVKNHINAVPYIDWKSLNELWTENLYLTIPFYSGFLSVNSSSLDCNIVPELKNIKPALMVSEHGLPEDPFLKEEIINYAKSNGLKVLNTHHCYYYNREHAESLQVLKCIKERTNFEKPELAGFSSDEFSFISYLDKEGENFEHAFQKVFSEYELPQLTNGIKLPEFIVEEKYKKELGLSSDCSNFEYFEKLLRTNLEIKIPKNEKYETYLKRLDSELEVFKKLHIWDYMLLVADVINYAKSNKFAVNRGRGSSAGSLIAYLLNIVEVDPVENNLYFSRFLSEARVKLNIVDGQVYLKSGCPDIDSDIEYHERHKVVEYVQNKYKGRTLKIGTSSTLTGKILIKEVTKIYLNYSEVDAKHIADYIERIFGNVISLKSAYEDSKPFKKWVDESEQNRKCYEIALNLEDLIRNKGTHASGIAVSHSLIDELIPSYISNQDSEISTCYDMKDIENILVKLDILGLKTLNVVKDAAEIAGIDWTKIDINDKIIYEYLNNSDCYYGLFQIEKGLGKDTCKKIKPKNINDLCAVLSIGRPSSMQFIDQYVKFSETGAYEKYDEILDDILKETGGCCLYQETLMRMGHEIFGLTLEDCECLRRIVGKKLVDEVKNYEELIKSKAKERNIPEDTVAKFWKILEDSSSYGFNKCLGEDSLIKTESGFKTIKDITVGDKVLAYDTSNNKNHYTEVIDVIEGEKELFEFEFEDGRKIQCSMEHKFLTEFGMLPISEIINKNLSIVCENDEYFKDVPGYEGYYKISNKGRLISLPRIGVKNRKYGEIEISPYIDRYGYKRVSIQNMQSGKKRFYVHRLVGIAFIENKNNLPCINHKDGNKLNNNVENLEWISVADNNRHAYKTGLNHFRKPPITQGESHFNSKLNENIVKEMRQLKLENPDLSYRKIGAIYNIDGSTAHKIIINKSWKHVK